MIDLKKENEEFKLFMLFKEAVESERRAQRMYQNLILACSDPKIKEILESFLKDEIRHEQEVIKRYNELKNSLKIQDELKD
ncbi:MAG: ferritin-like domain-containing protein [Thermoanaerobaculia bacterium]